MSGEYITLQLDEEGHHDTLILRADDISAVRFNPASGKVAFAVDHPHDLMGLTKTSLAVGGDVARDFLKQWSKAAGVKVPEFPEEPKADEPAPAPAEAKASPAKKAGG